MLARTRREMTREEKKILESLFGTAFLPSDIIIVLIAMVKGAVVGIVIGYLVQFLFPDYLSLVVGGAGGALLFGIFIIKKIQLRIQESRQNKNLIRNQTEIFHCQSQAVASMQSIDIYSPTYCFEISEGKLLVIDVPRYMYETEEFPNTDFKITFSQGIIFKIECLGQPLKPIIYDIQEYRAFEGRKFKKFGLGSCRVVRGFLDHKLEQARRKQQKDFMEMLRDMSYKSSDARFLFKRKIKE